MKKRFFAMFLVAAMLATLTACGSTSTEINNEVENTENSESVVESTEAEITEAEEPKEEEFIESTEIETVESEDTETVEVESIEADSESEEPAALTYTYTDLSATMYAQSSVNVRDLPSTDGAKLGSLSLNQEVAVTGQCNETSWFRIEYSGGTGYVSNKYLDDNKVEIVQTQESSSEQTSSNDSGITVSSSHWYDGYEMYTWYDMDEYYFAIVGNLDEAYEYLNTFPYSDVLELRYPDRTVVKGGTGPSDIHCAVVSACNMKSSTGAPIWSINYVWD